MMMAVVVLLVVRLAGRLLFVLLVIMVVAVGVLVATEQEWVAYLHRGKAGEDELGGVEYMVCVGRG